MFKTSLLAAFALVTFTNESQARPQAWSFLGGLAVGSVLANGYAYSAPPIYYTPPPTYYYPPRVMYYQQPPPAVYYREPRVSIVFDQYGNQYIQRRRY